MLRLFVPLILLLLFLPTPVVAGSNDVWKSCCSSGCDYSPGQTISFGGTTYYCCSDGWSTSTCGSGGTTTTTTTLPPTTTTTTLPPSPPQTTTTTSTTTTLPPCPCTNCGYFSSSNCDNACNEWQRCAQVTCSASGCVSNSNCYKCEVKSCSEVKPRIYILTPYITSRGKLTVSVYFECNEWKSTVKNLTLSLKIDDKNWAECFLNEKGLMTDFGWNNSCDNKKSEHCGKNNQWSCDSSANCKHSQYDLWVKSNFAAKALNITFTCDLPSLSAGTHSLTVVTKVYESEIELKPSLITFRVGETDGRKILEILEVPLKIIRRLLLPWLLI